MTVRTCSKYVAFSDESWFVLGNNKRYVWRQDGNFRPKGAVGYNFKSRLMFIEGTVTAPRYQEMLSLSQVFTDADSLYGVKSWYFQHDNARPHTAKESVKFIQNACVNILENWPAHSPDLSIIEHVWAIMGRMVEKAQPQTVDELKTILMTVWDELSHSTINSMVHTINRRLKQVIVNQGRQVHKF